MGFLAYLAQGVFDVGISIYEEAESDNRQGDEESPSPAFGPDRREEGTDSHDAKKDGMDEFVPGGEDGAKEGQEAAEQGASEE